MVDAPAGVGMEVGRDKEELLLFNRYRISVFQEEKILELLHNNVCIVNSIVLYS